MKYKNKKEDFLVCYQVHYVQVYQEIFLTSRRINRAGKGRGINRADKAALAMTQGRGILRTGYGNDKKDF